MGVLTVHHWSDRARGPAEMSRIPAALPSLHALPVRRPVLMAAPSARNRLIDHGLVI
jgi:hypothetical protein